MWKNRNKLIEKPTHDSEGRRIHIVKTVRCGECRHTWRYQGGLMFAKCPKCGRMVRVSFAR